MSVVSAPDLETAFRRIDTGNVAPDELSPVLSMTLQITSRSHNNAPGVGHLQTARRKVEWSGPHSGARVTRPFEKGSRRDELQHDPALSAYQVWSCVIRGNELAVYTADSFEAAHLKATAVFDPRVRSNDVESVIERVELHLAPDRRGYAPTCYWLWIEGQKVGWPPTATDPPPGPLCVEARMPIPRWTKVDAYAPGFPIRSRRRSEVRR